MAEGLERVQPSRPAGEPDRASAAEDAGVAPGRPAKAPLCAFATKAEELDDIKTSVNDAAAASGALWFSYLFVLFYLAIAVGAVTPADLFLENPVKLPFLSIELPLRAFFFLAPLLFLVSHVYTLVTFVIFSDKAKWFHRELRRQIAEAGVGDPERAAEIENDLRRQLTSNIFVQFLAGPAELRHGVFGFILKLIIWTTLVFAPAALLLLIQMQFLPFHDRFITWTHRLVLLVDLVAVWWLWSSILAGRFPQDQTRRNRGSRLLQGAGVGASVVVVAFSWMIATFPGEWQETELPSLRVVPGPPGHPRLSLHDVVFNGTIDPTTHRRGHFFTSTLILPVFDIYEALKIDDPGKVATRRSIFSARGRDLRGAVFDLSNLSQVDFEGADLDDASFDRATLHATSLYCARLRRASFYYTEMQYAWLHAADLEGADLSFAHGQAARFEGARLIKANFYRALLPAATFDGADLRGARLEQASLQGASIGRTYVAGECLAKQGRPTGYRTADLGASKLDEANLEAAVLKDVSLATASMRKIKLGDARLSNVSFEGASLDPDPASLSRGIRIDVAAGKVEGKPVPAVLASNVLEPSPYASGLAGSLIDLVCGSDANAGFVAKGLVDTGRLADTGPELPRVVDAALGDPCGVAGGIGADLKARLLALKRAALRRSP